MANANGDTNAMNREIGLAGAVLLGLGSIVGTGVFVSIGIATGVAGPNVLLAIFIASLLAICNGLSSAQLAASHPVSGGTYEYGYRWLTPSMGFSAGWLFLCAKSASAATALLGLSGYLCVATHAGEFGRLTLVTVALLAAIVLTILTLVGIKRTNIVNSLIVSVTLIALSLFVVFGFPAAVTRAEVILRGVFTFDKQSTLSLFHATALMFVAYTGYGRIATLGEEVHEPRKTIPRAMIITLIATMLLYALVGFVAVALVGPEQLASAVKTSIAPLLFATDSLNIPWLKGTVLVGAITAMLGVVLNLILGLSRVALAMARRGDLPGSFSAIDRNGIPRQATILVAVVVCGLVLLGDVRLSWSFSAFTVLLYYSLTNLCAILLEKESRLYPIWISWAGLLGCLSLACWLTPKVVLAGVIVLVVGFLLRAVFRRNAASKT